MIKRYIIYGFIGLELEVLWTGIESLMDGNLKLSSYTNLWMFFIYGMAVFLEPIHDFISNWRWPVRGLCWMIIIWGIEFLTGTAILNFFGFYAWYYNGWNMFNYLIRLDFAPLWFLAGLIFERFHVYLDQVLNN